MAPGLLESRIAGRTKKYAHVANHESLQPHRRLERNANAGKKGLSQSENRASVATNTHTQKDAHNK